MIASEYRFVFFWGKCTCSRIIVEKGPYIPIESILISYLLLFVTVELLLKGPSLTGRLIQ